VISKRLARPRHSRVPFSGATPAEWLAFFCVHHFVPPANVARLDSRNGERAPGSFFPPGTESAI